MGQFSSTQVCTTDACVSTASNILSNLAPHWKQLDPCTNFEEMVCYGYRESHEASQAPLYHLGDMNYRVVRRIVEGTYQDAIQLVSSRLGARGSVDELNFNMLKQNYQVCMDTDTIAKKGVTPLVKFTHEITSAWPLSVENLSKKPDAADWDAFAKVSVALGKVGSSLFNFETNHDPFDSSVILPTFARFDLKETDFTNEDKVAAYFLETNQTLSVLYPTFNATAIEEIAKGIVAFEAEIYAGVAGDVAALMDKIKKGADPMTTQYTKVPFSDLATIAPELRLDKVLLGLMPAGYTPKHALMGYLTSWPVVSAAIKKQPVAVMQGFVAIKTAKNFLGGVLPTPLDTPTAEARWKTCIEVLAGTQRVPGPLKYIVDRFFYQHAMSDLGRNNALKMIKNLKAEFKNRLNTYSWMSQESKQQAIKKVDNMIEEVGYQTQDPNVMSPDSLATYYSGLNVTDDFFGNLVSAKRHKFNVESNKCTKPPNRRQWDSSSAWANAFYSPMANGIYIHAGIARADFFHADLPQYAQYAGLGAILGHEITHGFDSGGSRWNDKGEFRQWMDNSTVAAFNEKAQCFVDQYSKFEFPITGGKKAATDARFTLGENMSDAAGLSLAYAAWQAERKSMPDVWDQQLPGLDEFTHEQLFFLMFGNLWCSNYAPSQNEGLMTDNHALNKYRILGSLANSRPFKEAFSCKKKEPECEVW
ncbi:hypothetical protein QBC38DRAFT_428337 [Podospora fimiseda]|uniref:Uncharacterized protein n=1 Tax=Podospora fimiseda TaxID=252190 RepID=A0AAN6YN80_9PEZI|nr:hypothetical protein QBC38DRAFT_428337 [Podospora fimiseda]